MAQFRAFWRATTAPLRSSDSGPGGLLLHLVLLGMFLCSSLVSRSCGRELVVLCLRLAWLGRRLTAEFVGALSSSELQMLSDAFRRSSPVDPLCRTLEPRRPPPRVWHSVLQLLTHMFLLFALRKAAWRTFDPQLVNSKADRSLVVAHSHATPP